MWSPNQYFYVQFCVHDLYSVNIEQFSGSKIQFLPPPKLHKSSVHNTWLIVVNLKHQTFSKYSFLLLVFVQVRDLTREFVESDIHFCGFVIISCPLKPDSLTVIKDLSYSSHHISMITGDNPLTACHVSSIVGIVRSNVPVLVLSPPNALRKYIFFIVMILILYTYYFLLSLILLLVSIRLLLIQYDNQD